MMKRGKEKNLKKSQIGLQFENELEQLNLKHKDNENKIKSDFQSFTQQRIQQKELLKNSLRYISDLIAFKKALNNENLNDDNDDMSIFELDNLSTDNKLEGIKKLLNYYKYNIETYELPNDWQLDCDEKSILTHDQNILNKTFSNMKKNQINIGEKYSKKISNIVKMIKIIENEILQELQGSEFSLPSPSVSSRISRSEKLFHHSNNYNILLDLKNALQECLEKYYDTYTYEVLSNPSGNMNSLDVFTWDYQYICPTFSMQMMAFKNIPKSSNRSKNDLILKSKEKNCTIRIPYRPILENCAIRRLEYSYDLLSEMSPSYQKPYNGRNISMNLIQVLENDENTLKEICDKVLIELNEKRLYFEALLIEKLGKEKKLLEDAKKKKTKDNEKKKSKKRKKKENKIISPNIDFGPLENYDIIEKLNEIRNNDFCNYLNGMQLKLSNKSEKFILGDINIRSHRILDGIQDIQLVKKPVIKREFILSQQNYTQVFLPRTLKRESMNDELKVFYKRNDENSIISDNMIMRNSDKRLEGGGDYEPLSRQQQQQQQQQQKTKSLKKFSNGYGDVPNEIEQDYFQFEFTLPSNILWWTEPIICYWEPWEESEEFQNLDENVKYFHLNYNKIMENLQNRLLSSKPTNQNESRSTYVQDDFPLNNIEKSIDFHYLLKKFIIPNLPYNFITKVEIEHDKLKDFNKKPHLITSIREQRQQLEDTASVGGDYNEIRNIFVEEFAKPLFQKFFKFRYSLIINPTTSENDQTELDEDSLSYTSNKNLMFSEFYNEILNISKSEEPYFKLPSQTNVVLPKETNQTVTDTENTKLQRNPSLVSTKTKKKKLKSPQSGSNRIDKTIDDANYPKVETANEDSQKDDVKQAHDFEKFVLIEHPIGRWCTRGIVSQEYDIKSKRMQFKTSKLGIFGIAAYRYHILPLVSWTMESHIEIANTIVLNIQTEYIDFQIYIDDKGYYLNFLKKEYFPFNIKKTMNFNDFKTKLRSIGLDIFPSKDASRYVRNNSEKLYQLEYHCYFSMVAFCKFFKFKNSLWNKYGNHREIILLVEEQLAAIEQKLLSLMSSVKRNETITKILPISKNDTNNNSTILQVLVTPFKCEIIKINEDCSDDLTKVKISYKNNEDKKYAHLSYQADLFGLLTSLYTQNINRNFVEFENKYLEWNLAQLLINMRLFSFS